MTAAVRKRADFQPCERALRQDRNVHETELSFMSVELQDLEVSELCQASWNFLQHGITGELPQSDQMTDDSARSLTWSLGAMVVPIPQG